MFKEAGNESYSKVIQNFRQTTGFDKIAAANRSFKKNA